jgi:urease subunit gamma/beta
MRLTPSEQDRLLLFLAAELARSRRGRGLSLNAVEASAIVADTVAEAARDGLRHAEAVAAGRAALSRDDLLPGVAELVANVCVEAVFDDGTRLVVVTEPFGPPGEGPSTEQLARLSAVEAASLPPGTVLPAASTGSERADDPRAIRVEVHNRADVAISVTSHFHFFEVNRQLDFDRRAAYGRRLAIDAGEFVRFEPGQARTVALVPFGGRRVAVGFSGLVDGPLDADGALESALARGRDGGFLGCKPSADQDDGGNGARVAGAR